MSDILEKCRKLLSLTSSDNPHEAQLAQERLGKFMAEHNIQMSSLEKVEQSQVGQTDIHAQGVNATAWWSIMCSEIAKSLGAIIIINKTGKGRKDFISIFSMKHSTEFIKEVIQFAIAEMERLYLKDYYECYFADMPRPKKPAYAVAFVRSYAQRIRDAYSKEVAATSGGALIVSNQQQVIQSYIDNTFGKLKTVKHSYSENDTSKALGFQAGLKAAIGKQLTSA